MDRRSRGHRSIFSACLDDDNESLERLFEGCSDSVQTVRDVNDSGQTALHIAASCGSYRCASFLLSKGADPMQRDLESGYTPLHIALYKGNIGIALLLVAAGALSDDQSELAILSAQQRKDSSRWLGPPLRASVNCGVSALRDYEGLLPVDILGLQCVNAWTAVVREWKRLGINLFTRKLELPKPAHYKLQDSVISSREELKGLQKVSNGGGGGGKKVKRSSSGRHKVKGHKNKLLDEFDDFNDAGVAFAELARSEKQNAKSSSGRRNRIRTLSMESEKSDTSGGSEDAEFELSGSKKTTSERLDLIDWAVTDYSSRSQLQGPLSSLVSQSPLSTEQRSCDQSLWIAVLPILSTNGTKAVGLNELEEDDDNDDEAKNSWMNPPTHWKASTWSWGRASLQLGYGAGSADIQATPRSITFPPSRYSKTLIGDPSLASPLIVTAAVARHHSLFVSQAGVLYTCGLGQGGRLGLPVKSSSSRDSVDTDEIESLYDEAIPDSFVQLEPTPVPYFLSLRLVVVSVAAGDRHSLCITSDGGIYSWGDNRTGACGFDTSSSSLSVSTASSPSSPSQHIIIRPRRIDGALRRSSVKLVSAGAHHTVVGTSEGTLWAFGSNWTGQLGMRDVQTGGAGAVKTRPSISDGSQHIVWLPKRMDPLPSAVAANIALNEERATMSGNDRGSNNAFRALAGESEASSFSIGTMAENLLASTSVVQIAASDTYTLLLTAGGDVWVCGNGGASSTSPTKGGSVLTAAAGSSWQKLRFDAQAANNSDSISVYVDASVSVEASIQQTSPILNSVTSSTPTGKQKSQKSNGLGKLAGNAAQEKAASEALAKLGFRVQSDATVSAGTLSSSPSSPKQKNKSSPTNESLQSGQWNTSGFSGGGRSRPATHLSSSSSSSTIASFSVNSKASSSFRFSRIAHISAAKHVLLALDDEGNVWASACSGREELLGIGLPSQNVADKQLDLSTWSQPRRISSLTRAGITIVSIAAGAHHCACISKDGSLFTWGVQLAADRGQLGHGKGEKASIPRRMQSLKQVLQVYLGDEHTLAVTGISIPPLPPLRPSQVDLAVAYMKTGSRPAVSVNCNQTDALHLYGPVIADETIEAMHLADVYRDLNISEEFILDGSTQQSLSLSLSLDLNGQVSGEQNGIPIAVNGSPVIFTPPSLKSICESILAKYVTVGSAASTLCIASDLRAGGLAAYCGALLSGNAMATLANACVPRGRERENKEFLKVSSCYAEGLTKWAWSPCRISAIHREMEHMAQQELVSRYKNMKRREYEIIRPMSIWRGNKAARSRFAIGGGAGVVPALSSTILPRNLDAIVAEDCSYVLKSLFVVVRPQRSLSLDVNANTSSTTSTTSTAAKVNSSNAPSLITFQTAYDSILAARSNLVRSGSLDDSRAGTLTLSAETDPGPSSLRRSAGSAVSSGRRNKSNRRRLLSSGEYDNIPDDGLEEKYSDDEDEHEGGGSSGALRALSGRLSPAAMRLVFSGETLSSGSGCSDLTGNVPVHYRTTLPSSAPTGMQSSLDRLAANLVELGCGPGQAGPSQSLNSGGGGGSSQSAEMIVNLTMCTDATSLMRRTKTLRKRLLEAVALAVKAAGGVAYGIAFSAQKRISIDDESQVSIDFPGSSDLEPEQLAKLNRRVELLLELWTVAPFIRSLRDLAASLSSSAPTSPRVDTLLSQCQEACEGYRDLEHAGLGAQLALPLLQQESSILTELPPDVISARRAIAEAGSTSPLDRKALDLAVLSTVVGAKAVVGPNSLAAMNSRQHSKSIPNSSSSPSLPSGSSSAASSSLLRPVVSPSPPPLITSEPRPVTKSPNKPKQQQQRQEHQKQQPNPSTISPPWAFASTGGAVGKGGTISAKSSSLEASLYSLIAADESSATTPIVATNNSSIFSSSYLSQQSFSQPKNATVHGKSQGITPAAAAESQSPGTPPPMSSPSGRKGVSNTSNGTPWGNSKVLSGNGSNLSVPSISSPPPTSSPASLVIGLSLRDILEAEQRSQNLKKENEEKAQQLAFMQKSVEANAIASAQKQLSARIRSGFAPAAGEAYTPGKGGGSGSSHHPTLLEIQREEEAMQKRLAEARASVMVNGSGGSRSSTSNVWRSPVKKGSDEALLAGGLHGLMNHQQAEQAEEAAVAAAVKAVALQQQKEKQSRKAKRIV